MKTGIGKLMKRGLPQIIIMGIVFITFCVTLLFIISGESKRMEFLFPSTDSNALVVEYRDLSEKAVQGNVRFFVDELLLGSGVERTKMLFMPGTKVLSCFQRESTLYLNLSTDLLFESSNVIPLKEGISLLEKNIKLNFPDIKIVELFVDGNKAFEI